MGTVLVDLIETKQKKPQNLINLLGDIYDGFLKNLSFKSLKKNKTQEI